jgi:hypothetical protein
MLCDINMQRKYLDRSKKYCHPFWQIVQADSCTGKPPKLQIIIISQSKAPKMSQGKLHDMNKANNHVIGKLGFKMSTLIIQDQLMI